MHYSNISHSPRLDYLVAQNQQHLLKGGLKGIEKESLRISKDGMISQLVHPYALGSALTHPHITTDYSEALLEFITPPFADIKETLGFMHTIHHYVYEHLGDEILLSASMPCGIDGDDSISIAEYGSSNIGQMKNVYRQGLWHRYGRTMQAIAGIHFNYSVPKGLWEVLYQHSPSKQSLADFISHRYFGLIRNFQRQGWLILYLFGASPAICKQFFKSRPHLMAEFDEFDKHTLFHPYATSLRMSDIGYKSKNQANLEIDYNSLTGYVDSLSAAINTPYSDYKRMGVKVNGEYKQLNANILQIENEYYSTVRPKQIAKSGEKPTLALKHRGVEYIEIRSLDLDIFNPIGIDEDKARFVEAFLLNCLLQESPDYTGQEQQLNNSNQLSVAHSGRQPDLELNHNGQSVALNIWATQILDSMQAVCTILDEGNPQPLYTQALKQQYALVENPDLTPSARVLQGMKAEQQPFGCFGLSRSALHQKYFKNQRLDSKTTQLFDKMGDVSHGTQKQIESDDTLSFDDFLQQYFEQT